MAWPLAHAIDDVKNEFCRFNYFLYTINIIITVLPTVFSVYKCIIIIIINDIIYGLNFIIITTFVVLSTISLVLNVANTSGQRGPYNRRL